MTSGGFILNDRTTEITRNESLTSRRRQDDRCRRQRTTTIGGNETITSVNNR